ncbi:MAG: hypothetical protein IT294_09055 [Deltaproteobacteria bacterium]|nr:hypothetical protein [Deltaproteobacteria bacterium]
MLHRRYAAIALRVGSAALVLTMASTPAAFARGGHDARDGHERSKGFFDGDDERSIPDCGRHDDDWDDDRHGGHGGRDRGDRLFCPNKQVLVRTDEKLCPEKPNRPAVVRKRVCCRHGSMTWCRPFRPCPPRSRS